LKSMIFNFYTTIFNFWQGGVVRKAFFGVIIVCALVTTALLLRNYIGGGRDCVEAALYDSGKLL